MYGYISNNLAIKVDSYITLKSQEVEYSYTNPIDNDKINVTIELINKSKISTIIIDGSCFYTEDIALEFCYQLKLANPIIRIIFISFTKKLLSQIAMIGIYDIIYYEKKMKLEKQLDEILIQPKKLSDISDYFNLEMIQNNSTIDPQNNKASQVILCFSLDDKVFATTFLLNLIKNDKLLKNSCLIEGPNTKKTLKEFLYAFDNATTSDMNKEFYKTNENSILFNDNLIWERENILNILLNVKNKYENIIFDLGKLYLIESEILKELLKYTTKIIIFDTDCLIMKKSNQYNKMQKMIEEFNLEVILIKKEEITNTQMDEIINVEKNSKMNDKINELFLTQETNENYKDKIKRVVLKKISKKKRS